MTVCWYDSDDAGATTLNNVAGSFDAVLYAALVTGYNAKSITSVSVSGGIATATCAGHGYSASVGKSVDIAGCAVAALNGRKQPLTVTSGAFTFAAVGVADTGSAGGTITAKRSPLGWARVASAGNKSIYARTDVAATAQVLCLDDSGAGNASGTTARVVMAEAWTAADAFTGLAPTAAQRAGGLNVVKGANSTAAKKWAIFGDSRLFYIFTEGTSYVFSSFPGLVIGAFGDIVSDRAGDAFHSILSFYPGEVDGPSGVGKSFALGTGASTDLYLSRLSNQIGSAISSAAIGSTPGGNLVGAVGPSYPSPVNNGAVIQTPVLIAESNPSFNNPIRGILPGLAHPLCQGLHVLHLKSLPNVTGSTRNWVVVATLNQGSLGAVVIDTTGPWR